MFPINQNTEALTEKFACYFTEKISKIREELDIIETVTPSVKEMSTWRDNHGLDSFEPLTEAEVNKILKNLSKKTCSLDVVPNWLIIECADSLTPAITSIVNCSLESGEMPVDLKTAIVKPLLKRADLDRECLKHYRPVINLSCLSKIIEKVVASKLHSYLNQKDIFPKFQSAYRQKHSKETALTRVQNDLNKLTAKKQHVMLVLLGLSAAFDKIDKDILCQRLRTYIGISNLELKWLNSYLNNRSMSVSIENSFSAPTPVRFGVLQGSVLGPILYSMYTAPLCDILSAHMYADDTQLYIPIENDNSNVYRLEKCITDIKNWVTTNKLKLNGEKTEIIILSNKSKNVPIDLNHLNYAGEEISIPSANVVRNLGVYFDSNLTMESHIKKVTQFQLQNIGKIRDLIDKDIAHMLVHSFVTSRLDYCNMQVYHFISWKDCKKFKTRQPD